MRFRTVEAVSLGPRAKLGPRPADRASGLVSSRQPLRHRRSDPGREPAADLAGPTGQAPDAQPGPHAGQIGELSPSGGPSQRGQHCQARCECGGHHRGGHWPGRQPQQAQAQEHQRQNNFGTATRGRDAAPARDARSPSGGAHNASGQAPAIPGPVPCLTPPGPGVLAVGWAKTRPGGLAATECRAVPARSACGPPSPPAAHPATRTAIAPSSAPAGRDRARTCQPVIAPSRYGSSAASLTHRRRDRFPPGVGRRPASSG